MRFDGGPHVVAQDTSLGVRLPRVHSQVMANLTNPKEELKIKSEQYAKYLEFGLSRSRRKPFSTPAEGEAFDINSYKGKSFWELWTQSTMHQYYMTQWAMQNADATVQAMVKFQLQVAQLSSSSDTFVDTLCKALADGTGGASQDVAKSAAPALHAATRGDPPFNSAAFMSAITPLLDAVSGAKITCDAFIDTPRHGIMFNDPQ